MARQPRFFFPGATLHVVQRGNNRQRIFRRRRDYEIFRGCLTEALRKHAMDVHAYVLMPNHLHLLVSPRDGRALPNVLQSIGRRYVRYFNDEYGRTGTLWEGRYRASVIDSETYLVTCMRYIELNPVRAGIVPSPRDYPYSSYPSNAEGVPDSLVAPHGVYERLGFSSADRRAAYRALFASTFDAAHLHAIRDATNKNWTLGDDAFAERVSLLTGRRGARLKPKGVASARRLESDPTSFWIGV